MKTFQDICRMTQQEVKDYMFQYLSSKKYNVVNEDGFLYARGTVPVLLVAHMDTVHKDQCKVIVNVDGKMSSPQGIGGDDRCGVFMIMNIVKDLNCSVLLCEDEESGGIGARKFTKAKYKWLNENGESEDKAYIDNLDVNFMIEFDRRGNNDAVFYSCDNKDFIDFVTDVTGFKTSQGSFSDISVLMPAAKLSAVNLSCGYYNAHMVTEYVMYDEMMDTIEAAKVLIKEKCDGPFKYVAKTYVPMSSYVSTYYNNNHRFNNPSYAYPKYDNDGNGYYGNMLDDTPSEYKDDKLAALAIHDTDIELEVIITAEDLSEDTIVVEGATKAECWMNLFLENPNLCFNDIVDYSWG